MRAKRIKDLDPAGRWPRTRRGSSRSGSASCVASLPEALEPEAAEVQHNMRIAAKRLRYVLEATGFCFGARPQPPAGAPGAPGHSRRDARRGRDAAAPRRAPRHCAPRTPKRSAARPATPRTSIRRSAGRAPHRTAYRGLEVLEVYLLARRRLLFDRFAELCRTRERGVWSKLDRAADRDRARAAPARGGRAGGAGAGRARRGRAGRREAERAARPRRGSAEAERRRHRLSPLGVVVQFRLRYCP